MKTLKILSFIVAALAIVCHADAKENKAGTTQQEDIIEVLVFHGVKQCETCQAIKKNTREVVEEQFANLPDGKIVVFKIIDFSLPENKKIAEKYEIAWTSVLLVKHSNGQEEVNNISQFAIKNARTNTETYRKTLSEDITRFLN